MTHYKDATHFPPEVQDLHNNDVYLRKLVLGQGFTNLNNVRNLLIFFYKNNKGKPIIHRI